MIKSVTFKNFRNLDGKYEFNNTLNVIIGKNNSGKTNLLDGIKLLFQQLLMIILKYQIVILKIVKIIM